MACCTVASSWDLQFSGPEDLHRHILQFHSISTLTFAKTNITMISGESRGCIRFKNSIIHFLDLHSPTCADTIICTYGTSVKVGVPPQNPEANVVSVHKSIAEA